MPQAQSATDPLQWLFQWFYLLSWTKQLRISFSSYADSLIWNTSWILHALHVWLAVKILYTSWFYISGHWATCNFWRPEIAGVFHEQWFTFIYTWLMILGYPSWNNTVGKQLLKYLFLNKKAQQTINFLLISFNIYKCIALPILRKTSTKNKILSQTRNTELGIESSGFFCCLLYIFDT